MAGPKNYQIYMITFPNGKKYIGLTSDFKNRKLKHLNPNVWKRFKCKLYSAMKCYGSDGLIWDLILTCFDLDSARSFEQHFIKYYNTFETGYNMTLGGEGTFGYTPWNKGLKSSPETCKKISDSKKGKPGNWKGIKRGKGHWTGTKRPVSVIEKMQKNSSHNKPVICLNDSKIFNSASEAARFYNLKPYGVCDAAAGRINSHHGYKFKYLENVNGN